MWTSDPDRGRGSTANPDGHDHGLLAGNPGCGPCLGVVMPFLINAKRVIVVSVAETNADYTAEGTGAVSRYLLWNEVPAETEIIKTRGATPELLASAAQRHRADLVVLGAYGHSQMRERLFGGCRQFFIRNAERPVLMMH
jgi:nucleotide-binding universal stress UspA family protein